MEISLNNYLFSQMRELLSYGLIHPAITPPERNQIEQWANKISNIALKGNNDGE